MITAESIGYIPAEGLQFLINQPRSFPEFEVTKGVLVKKKIKYSNKTDYQ
jgi:hypothetical protein